MGADHRGLLATFMTEFDAVSKTCIKRRRRLKSTCILHFWSHGSTNLAWEFVEIHPFPACRAVRRSSQWGRFCCLTAFCFVILALIRILCYTENSTHTSPLCAGDILIQRRTKGSTVRWQRSVSRNVGKVKACIRMHQERRECDE